MQRLTIKENGKTFTVKMPENFDMGKILIEPTPLSTTELEGIKAKVKETLTMMLDVITNPEEPSDNKLLVTIAVNNFINLFEDARNDHDMDHISITFIQENNVILSVNRTTKLENDGRHIDTYGSRLVASVTFMLLPKGADIGCPSHWHVRYSDYDGKGVETSSLIDYFEDGEETVNKLKALIKSVCTLSNA